MAEQHVHLNWNGRGSVEFSLESKGLGHLKTGGLNIEFLPAQIGVGKESAALLKRCRAHEVQAIDAFEIETESRLPFGSEPFIVRQYTLWENLLRAVSDIRVGRSMQMGQISSDSLCVSGSWRSLSLFHLPLEGEAPRVETFEPGQKVFYASAQPWLSAVVTAEDGSRFEMTAGEDLWRLTDAVPEDGKRSFRISVSEGKLLFERGLGVWSEAKTFARRSWRSKWHAACGCAGKKKAVPASVIDVRKLSLPDEALRSTDGQPCAMSSAMMKTLHRLVRSAAGSDKPGVIAVRGWEPGFCWTAAHCGRSGERPMLHWDLGEMMMFHFWANKQLVPHGGGLVIEVEESSPFAQLPSVRGLSQVPKGR